MLTDIHMYIKIEEYSAGLYIILTDYVYEYVGNMFIETRVFFLSPETPSNAYLILVGINMKLPYYILIDRSHHLN